MDAPEQNPLASVRDTRIPQTLRDLGAAKFAIFEVVRTMVNTEMANWRAETVAFGRGEAFDLTVEYGMFHRHTTTVVPNPKATQVEALKVRETATPTAAYASDGKVTYVWAYTADGNVMSLDSLGIVLGGFVTPESALADVAMMLSSGNYGSYELTERLYSSVLWGSEEARKSRALNPMDTMPTDIFPSEDVVDLYTQGADARGAKVTKRAAKLSAPTVANAVFGRPLKVKVLPANPALDGWIVIHSRIATEAQKAAKGVSERQTKATKDRIRSNVAFNGTTIGHMVDQDGNRLNAMLKGQHVVSQNRQAMGDFDIITSADNIKEEMFATWENVAVVATNPQGPKEYRLDGQTLVNNPQFFPHEVLEREFHREFDQLRDAFIEREDYSMIITDEQIVRIEENLDDPDLGDTFTSAMNWRVTNWFVSALDPKMSPFIYESMGRMITQRFFWNPRAISEVNAGRAPASGTPWFTRLGISIPNARRAQVISVAAAHLAGVRVVVPDGWPTWSERLGMMVFSDRDYTEVIQPSHGGSDLDDFYGLILINIEHPDRVVGYSGLRTNHHTYLVVARNPNAAGEYSVWPAKLDRMFSPDRDEDGKQIPFIEPDAFWRPQILQAQDEGHLTIHPLNPDPQQALAEVEDHTKARVADIVETLTARGPNSVLDRILYRRMGKDAREAIQANARQSVTAMGELTPEQMPNFSRIKDVIGAAMRGFWDEVEAISQGIEPHPALLDLFAKPNRNGLAEIKGTGETAVKNAIRGKAGKAAQEAKSYLSKKDADAMWLELEEDLAYKWILRNRFQDPIRNITSSEHGVAVYNALRLWLAFLVQPTKGGRISDRVIMADDRSFSLLTYALYVLGFSGWWYPTSEAHEAALEQDLRVGYSHPNHPFRSSAEGEMVMRCTNCGTTYTITTPEGMMKALRSYISNKGECAECRNSS